MKLCALCLVNEANKSNTHYLTDSIIRSALNEDGHKGRGRGLYYKFTSSKPSVDFNFQQASVGKIEEALGRPATEDEITQAIKNTEFSVDDIFCGECEDRFTAIENLFLPNILLQFRNNDISDSTELFFEDTKALRLFFLLQVWRSAICDELFRISDDSLERIRLIILDGINADVNALNDFPLSITYLITEGGAEAFTRNLVSCMNKNNPYVIFMNDFFIQFYDNEKSVEFNDFYGINNIENYEGFINIREEEFIVKVLSNDERITFLNLFGEEMVDNAFESIIGFFITEWRNLYKVDPSGDIKKEYLEGLTDWDDLPTAQRMSQERIAEFTSAFINSKKK